MVASTTEARVQIIEGGTIHHVGIVVHDVEKSAAALAESGIGPWHVWSVTPEASTVRGKDVPFSFRVAFAAVGDSNFELIAPDGGDSVFVGFLEEHGEGMHHTCIAYATREALNVAKTELARQGREMVQSADMGELGEFCFFEMPELGSIVELLYLTPLPPPEMTIG
jgi:methylmalonyl-CoA/ethylmalonyl-CoA epimerase